MPVGNVYALNCRVLTAWYAIRMSFSLSDNLRTDQCTLPVHSLVNKIMTYRRILTFIVSVVYNGLAPCHFCRINIVCDSDLELSYGRPSFAILPQELDPYIQLVGALPGLERAFDCLELGSA